MAITDEHARHVPVLLREVLEALAVRPDGRYVDATVGEGGHARAIAERLGPQGRLLAVDRDEDALASARPLLAVFPQRVALVRASFGGLRSILEQRGWGDGVDGILIDLGLSSLQLRRAERGFSFTAEGPLDMRMDRTRGGAAADLVNTLGERELADLLWRYGEERASRRIAREIVRRRQRQPLRTTVDLRAAVVAAGVRGRPGHDPATRTFQALRIAVNDELGELSRLLEDGWQLLRAGGRFVAVTYHSLEDRLVKEAFRTWAADCLCPPWTPTCTCGWRRRVRFVVRRRLRPSANEVQANPRARSAGLRAVERLADPPVDPAGRRAVPTGGES